MPREDLERQRFERLTDTMFPRSRLCIFVSCIVTFTLVSLVVGSDLDSMAQSLGLVTLAFLFPQGNAIWEGSMHYRGPDDLGWIRLIETIVTGLFLAWPLLAKRSSRLAAIAALVAWLPLLALFYLQKTLWTGNEDAGWLGFFFPYYWSVVVAMYVLRGLWNIEDRDSVGSNSILDAIKSCAYGAVMGLVPYGAAIVTLPLVIFLWWIAPIVSIVWFIVAVTRKCSDRD